MSSDNRVEDSPSIVRDENPKPEIRNTKSMNELVTGLPDSEFPIPMSSKPTTLAALRRDTIDSNDQRSDAHWERLRTCQIGDGDERRGQLPIELAEHLRSRPVIVHVALHLLEVTAGDTAGVGDDVGNHEDPALDRLFLGFRCGGTVGALGDDPDTVRDRMGVFCRDLVFQCGWNQDVDVLGQPGFALEDLEPEILRLRRVDIAEPIGGLTKLLKVDSVGLAKSNGRTYAGIPTRNTRDRATDLGLQLDGVLCHSSESLDAGSGRTGLQLQLFERLA